MQFEWHEEKRLGNLKKHGIDFIDATDIFADFVLCWPSSQTQHSEQRFVAVGQLDGRLITVVFTERGELRRLISARRARKNEEKRYHHATQAR